MESVWGRRSQGVGGDVRQQLLRSLSPPLCPRLHLLSMNPDTDGQKSSSADSKEEVVDVSVIHKYTQSKRRDRRQTVATAPLSVLFKTLISHSCYVVYDAGMSRADPQDISWYINHAGAGVVLKSQSFPIRWLFLKLWLFNFCKE